MLAMLDQIGSFADPDVYNVLDRMAKKDPDKDVARIAQEILMRLLGRHATADFMDQVEAGRGRSQRGASRSEGTGQG